MGRMRQLQYWVWNEWKQLDSRFSIIILVSDSLFYFFFSLLKLKLCNSDWDLNPQAGTRTQPKPRLGLEPPVFQLRSHTWSQDLMKFRFLISHHRKNSVRDKVIGTKWIYLERNTLHRQSVGHLRRREQPQGMGLSLFIGVGNFVG